MTFLFMNLVELGSPFAMEKVNKIKEERNKASLIKEKEE